MDVKPSSGRVGKQTIETINQRLDSALSRREFLYGASSVIGGLLLGGVAAADLKTTPSSAQRSELTQLPFADACGELPVCELEQSIVTPVGSQPVRANLNPTTTTTIAAPPPPVETVATSPPTTTETPPMLSPFGLPLESDGNRKMPYSEFEKHKEQMIAVLPTLATLSQGWGGQFYGEAERQLEFIQYLDNEVQLTPQGYQEFLATVEMSNSEAFLHQGLGVIDPKMIIWHWTGADYLDIPTFINALDVVRGGLGVQAYIHNDESPHQLTPTFTHKAYHAYRLADFSVGIEVHSGADDKSTSHVYYLTPEKVTKGLYMATKIYKETNMLADHTTFLSHHSADLIFVNPGYNPYTGEFAPGAVIRKHDVVQDMVVVLLRKLQKLQIELSAA